MTEETKVNFCVTVSSKAISDASLQLIIDSQIEILQSSRENQKGETRTSESYMMDQQLLFCQSTHKCANIYGQILNDN